MKKTLLLATLAAGLGLTGAQATDFYWNGANIAANPANGGTGNWSLANGWRTGSASGSQGTWANGAGNNAIFGGVSGTLTIDSGLSTGVTAGTLTVNTDGYTILSAANGRPLAATSLILANNVGLTFNMNSTGATWALGGITFGTSSSLSVTGVATAANANRVNLNVANATISGGSITLNGTGAGATGFVATAANVAMSTNITNNSLTSATMLGATSGNSLTYSGIVSGNGGLQFSAGPSGGAGTLTLGNQNTYTGMTIFNSSTNGVLKLGADDAISTVSNVLMASSSGQGGVLDLNGHNQTVASLASGAGGGNITNGAAGTFSTLTVSGTSDTTFGLVIQNGSGTTALTKSGVSTLTLTGTNTYTGGTRVTGGVLSVAGDAQLGTAPGSAADNITIDGGRLEISSTGTLNANRNILLGSNTTSTFSTKGGSTVVTYNGVFKDATTGGVLIKQGGGTLALGGVSSYTGNTAINNGTLQLTTGSNRLPTGTVVSIGQGGSSNVGTFDLNGQNQRIAGLNSISGNAVTGTNLVTSAAAATLTIGGTGSYSFGSTSSDNSGVINGAVSIVKAGSGTQTFGGANTYTGATTITAGTLLVQGANSGSGLVEAQSGGAIGGHGSIAGSLQLDAGSKFVFSLTDTLVVNGSSVTFGGFGMGDVVGLDSSVATGTYTLIGGSAAFNYANVANFGSANAYDLGGGKSAYFQSGGLEVVVVPEPQTWVLLGLGAVAILWRARRKLA